MTTKLKLFLEHDPLKAMYNVYLLQYTYDDSNTPVHRAALQLGKTGLELHPVYDGCVPPRLVVMSETQVNLLRGSGLELIELKPSTVVTQLKLQEGSVSDGL